MHHVTILNICLDSVRVYLLYSEYFKSKYHYRWLIFVHKCLMVHAYRYLKHSAVTVYYQRVSTAETTLHSGEVENESCTMYMHHEMHSA